MLAKRHEENPLDRSLRELYYSEGRSYSNRELMRMKESIFIASLIQANTDERVEPMKKTFKKIMKNKGPKLLSQMFSTQILM